MIYMFYAEDLKRFIVKSLQTTNDIFGVSNKKLKLDDHLNRIVDDGIITSKEKKELVSLFDFRNDIAHEIHKMVSDFGEAKKYLIPDEEGRITPHYQFGSLYRLKVLNEKIHRGFQRKYAMMASFHKFMFEPAERALEHEMKVIFKRMLKLELVEIYRKPK